MISNEIIRLKYGDWLFKGANTTETMLDMKAQLNASLRDIGEAFNVSHETVNLRFAEFRKNNPDEWGIIKSKSQFYENFKNLYHQENEVLANVAERLYLSIGQARKLKYKLIPKEERNTKLSTERRKKNLCYSLFGVQFIPGDGFDTYVKGLFKKYLNENEQKDLTEYYFENVDVEQDTRFARFQMVSKLKKEFDKEDLQERNVICKNQRL